MRVGGIEEMEENTGLSGRYGGVRGRPVYLVKSRTKAPIVLPFTVVDYVSFPG